MTLAEDARVIAAEVFADPDMVGISRRAVIRYVDPGIYRDGVAGVGDPVDLPCRAMLLAHVAGAQGRLEIDPRGENWLLEGIPRTVDAQGIFLETDPDTVVSAKQFEPGEGHLLVVETEGGDERFLWTGGIALFGDAKAIIAASDVSVGTGAIWQVTARPA